MLALLLAACPGPGDDTGDPLAPAPDTDHDGHFDTEEIAAGSDPYDGQDDCRWGCGRAAG